MPKVYNMHKDDVPPGAVYVGRGSKWGNPYPIDFHRDRKQAIELFRRNVLPYLNVEPLRGKDLVCHCAPLPCHAELLLEKANDET